MISCKISFGICWNLSFFSSVSSWSILYSSWSILHSSWLHSSVKRSEAKVSPTWGLAREGKSSTAWGLWRGKASAARGLWREDHLFTLVSEVIFVCHLEVLGGIEYWIEYRFFRLVSSYTDWKSSAAWGLWRGKSSAAWGLWRGGSLVHSCQWSRILRPSWGLRRNRVIELKSSAAWGLWRGGSLVHSCQWSHILRPSWGLRRNRVIELKSSAAWGLWRGGSLVHSCQWSHILRPSWGLRRNRVIELKSSAAWGLWRGG